MKTILAILLIQVLITSCVRKNTSSPSSPSGPPNLVQGEEWIKVPANAGGMGLALFYVMKYEAKAMLNDESSTDSTGTTAARVTHKPVSIAENQPWRNIDANDSAAECESLGTGYHLISNQEWMAIARDIENQPVNWTGRSVGSGCLFRGNSGEATIGDGTLITDSCGYDGGALQAGSSRDVRAKHNLSNDQQIFDFSGNVNEWTDWHKDSTGFQVAPSTCSIGWVELPSFSCAALLDSNYNSQNRSYTSADGVGQIYGAIPYLGNNTGASARGGRWGNNVYAGVYSLYMYLFPTFTNINLGFRCVYRPF
jgi:formylglycine-generating enzyme required for sulfatase activity